MVQVAPDSAQLFTEICDHLFGLPHRVSRADQLPVGVERYRPGEKRKPGAGLDDGGVGVDRRREEGGDGDALDHVSS